ncbi:MAG: PqqD family protein [Deltaproteobacteria bacterium]|nr:PqqD family protein [Deltaproteobacteria bacterium]
MNYLDYVPRRSIDHEEGDDGKLVLLRPKFMSGPLAKLLQPRITDKHLKVKLDDLGTATWRAIDGKRNVGQIADLLFEEFGDQIEPRYDRMSRFIDSLAKSKMVTFESRAPAKQE